MVTVKRQLVRTFVERSSQQWIVRDPEGSRWIVPLVENSWGDNREPFHPTERTELEPVADDYACVLSAPFCCATRSALRASSLSATTGNAPIFRAGCFW